VWLFIQNHVDLSDAQGNPLVCKASVPCHRYFLADKERLQATIDAGVAHARVGINFCPCHGNHKDPNPLGRGGGAGNRRGCGAGRNDLKECFGKRHANKECDYFKKGMCMNAQKTKPALRRTLGTPARFAANSRTTLTSPASTAQAAFTSTALSAPARPAALAARLTSALSPPPALIGYGRPVACDRPPSANAAATLNSSLTPPLATQVEAQSRSSATTSMEPKIR
jgi:hypothetical protein